MAINWSEFTPVDSSAPRSGGKVDWSQFEPIKPDDSGNFMRGAKVALGQTVPILKGVAGLVGATAEQTFGEGGLSTGLKNWGLKGYNEDMAGLAPLQKDTDELTTAWERAKSGNVGALVDWAQFGLGYMLGQVGESAALAIIGGAAGAAVAPEVAPVAGAAGAVAGIVGKGGVKTLATNLIEKAVVKEANATMTAAAMKEAASRGVQIAEKDALAWATKEGIELSADAAVKQATKNVARNIAATGALVGYGTAQELGSIYPEAEGEAAKKGETLDGGDLARVWATGLAAGGVEGLTDKLGLDVALGKVRIPGAGRAGRALLGGTAGALTEGGTEAAQTVLERIGAGQDLTSQDAIHDYINSAGLGALGGGGLGAVGGMLHPRQQAAQDQAMRDLAGAQTADEAIAAAQRAADAQVSPLAEAQGLMQRAAQRRAARLAEATDAARGEMATSLAPKPSPYPALPAPDGPPTGFTVDANGNVVPTWDDAYRAQARQPEPPPRGPLALPAPEGGPTTIAVDAQGNAAPSWGGNTSTVVGESLAGWQARRAEQETLAGWASTHPPVGWDSAVRVVQGAQDRGMDWSVLDHPDGGFMAVPTQYLTPRTATRAGIEFKNRMARVMAPTTERTRQQAGEPQVIEGATSDQLVRQMVEQRRNDGTLSGRAFAKEFDAGRITPADVLATMPNPEQVSPDERLAAAAAQAQPQVDPVTDRLTQIVRQAMAGQPKETGIALIDGMRKRGSSASAAPAPVIPQAASTSPADQALEATTKGVNHGREEVGQGQGRRQERLLTEPAGANRDAAPAPSPVAQAIDAVAHEAATSPRNDLPEPTQAQKQAGNYKKGHTTWNGLGLTIENPQGSERSGVDPGGKAWKVTLAAHYGYVKRTEGNDGDQVDLYMGPNPESGRVFVVDQVEARTGEFDEHKAIAGVDSLQQALDLYDAGFSDGKGPQRRGAVTEMSVDQFKAWVRDGVKNQPVGRIRPNDAKRANDRLKALGATAAELAGQIQEEATQSDFRPSELPDVVEQWAQDAKLGAAELRDAVLAIIRKSGLSDGRKVQIARALAKVGAEPAQPTKEQPTDVPQPAPPATQEGQAPGAQAEAPKPGPAAGKDGAAGWWNGLTQDQRAAEIARLDLRTAKGKPANPAHTWMLLSKAMQEKVRAAFGSRAAASEPTPAAPPAITSETASDVKASPATGDTPSPDAAEPPKQERTTKLRTSVLRHAGAKMAEQSKQDQSRDRNTNTARRAQMASGAEADARKREALGNTMVNLADAIEAGRAPGLEGITTKTQVEALDQALRRGMAESERGLSYADQQKQKGRAPTQEDARNAKLPRPSWGQQTSRDKLLEAIKGKKGARDVASIINTRGAPTNELLAGLRRLGVPDRTIEAGLGWWNIEQLANLARFERAGIKTDQDLHAALTQYIEFRDGPKAEDAVKAAERALIGQKVGVDFFPTPKATAERMAEAAGIRPGMRVLEPSAGNGNLADAAKAAGGTVDVVEVSDSLRKVLEAKGYNLAGRDFMEFSPGPVYDAVVMNPPFSDRQDALHIRHAMDMLKPGGRLVAIAGEGVFNGSDKAAQEFRAWLDEQGATVEKLPPGTFTDNQLLARTGANARLIEITKAGRAEAAQPASRADELPAAAPAIAGATPAPAVTEESSSTEPADPLDAKLQSAAGSLKDGQQVTIQVQVGDTGKTAEMTMGAKDALADVRKRLADAMQLMRCLK